MKGNGSNRESALSIYFIWFRIVSVILVLVGMVFAFFGFTIFPANILPRNAMLSWVSSIYGAVLIGLGTMLFLLGRLVVRRKDPELMKIMLIGVAVWLMIEAVFFAYLGVFFNIGVDIAVLALFAVPALKIIQYLKQDSDTDNSHHNAN